MKTRSRFALSSVRARLALWNVGVLALVLVGLGVVFSVSMRANVRAAVDRRLSQRSHHIQQRIAGMTPDQAASFLAGRDPFFSHGGVPPPGPPPREDDAFGEMPPRIFRRDGQPQRPDGDALWDRRGFERALRGGENYTTVRRGGDVVRVHSAPLRWDGSIVAVLQSGNSLAHLRAEEARTTRTLLTLIPLALLVAGLGGAFLTDRALRPVRRLAQEACRIEAENLARRLPVAGDDEFSDLAETFNAMLGRLQTAFERQEAAMEQQRRFAADASHELRTPLTIIKANTSLALSGPRTAPELLKTVQTVNTAADRMNRIVQDLLLLARSDAGQLTYPLAPTMLSDVLEQAVAGLAPDAAPVTLSLSSPALRVEGQADALVRLFGNLLENAARYTPRTGRITVTAEAVSGRVSVAVADTGEGIAPEHLPHVTERFYRVEASRSRPKGGTGLGLAICRSIVDAHGGQMTIESIPGVGTTVRVTLLEAEEPVTSVMAIVPGEATQPLARH